ncbi:YdcF family protein [Massilia sp. MB5]|uniref:YdcF family protein n=1 Tax=Massilia sp. MB5 TaxID=2919578 RepID=UPI001F0D6AFC|nr:YdcF family protein [Massilia sp. MB5]UMR30087.1 YdcF family protein [Massilia sp. MB5]
MTGEEMQRIADYIMPSLPARPSDLGFLFGTRHGVREFCEAAYTLWQAGMFPRLLVSGGCAGDWPQSKAAMIGEELLKLGLPESALILESSATNTGENVIFGRSGWRKSWTSARSEARLSSARYARRAAT